MSYFTFENDTVKSQWYAKHSKPESQALTKAETNKSGMRTCDGTRNTVVNEYESIAQALQEQADREARYGVRTETRHDLRQLLKKVA